MLAKLRDIQSEIKEVSTKVEEILNGDESVEKIETKVKEIVDKRFSFSGTLSSGVQGVVGCCTFYPPIYTNLPGLDPGEPVKLVYKKSLAIDFSIEHELLINDAIKELREYLPNIVYNVGSIVTYGNYVYSKDDDIFEKDYKLPYQLLLYEKLDRISLYRLIREYVRCSIDKRKIKREKSREWLKTVELQKLSNHCILSQILQLLFFLEEAQRRYQFVHYDLHISNILLQECDYNTLLLYKMDDTFYLFPSFGYVPVIIDTGVSHIKGMKSMTFSTANYHKGVRTSEYDRLNDVHHLLISLFYEMNLSDDKSDSTLNIYTKITKEIFKPIRFYEEEGWKRLKVDVMEEIADKFRESKEFKKLAFFVDNIYYCMDILGFLVRLPVSDNSQDPMRRSSSGDVTKALISFMKECQKFFKKGKEYKIPSFIILKEIVQLISIVQDGKLEIKDFKTVFKTQINKYYIPYKIPYNDIDFKVLVKNALSFAKLFKEEYRVQIQKDNDVIEEKYRTIPYKSPIDFIRYLLRNSDMKIEVGIEVDVQFYDLDNKSQHLWKLNQLEQKDIQSINRAYNSEKGRLLYKLLNTTKDEKEFKKNVSR